MKLKKLKIVALTGLMWLSACSFSTFGKFQAKEGIPEFIKKGVTTKTEIFSILGEPLVHRFMAGNETVIYNSEQGEYFILYGTYEGAELVIRFQNEIVSDVKIEKTGSGWGFLISANSNNPGTRRSAR